MDLPLCGHQPVLIDQTLALLQLGPGNIVVDCTVGRAGHSRAIASLLGTEGLLLGIDADPRNLEYAHAALADVPCRVCLFHANFAELDEVLAQANTAAVDAILADLGLSTNQFFDPAYGLSFSQSMPLDMRIDPRTHIGAADLINKCTETELASVLYELAQERYSRRIARKIVEGRRSSPIMTTDRLAELVRSAVPSRGHGPARIDPATKTFLALRMAVNREVENLAALLEQAPRRLKTGGRFVVISFQSTEDRMVKQAFRSAEQAGVLQVLTRKPLTPAADELAANPRSRSAKLRGARRIG